MLLPGPWVAAQRSSLRSYCTLSCHSLTFCFTNSTDCRVGLGVVESGVSKTKLLVAAHGSWQTSMLGCCMWQSWPESRACTVISRCLSSTSSITNFSPSLWASFRARTNSLSGTSLQPRACDGRRQMKSGGFPCHANSPHL